MRNRLRHGLIGRLLELVRPTQPPKRLIIASATRMDEATFWKQSALGRSLAIRRADSRLVFQIAFNNQTGLASVYNAVLQQAQDDDAVLFLHDDVWLDDPQWIDKLFLALKRFDVVGLAGNRRRVRKQPAWLFIDLDPFVYDAPNLSGVVCHGRDPRGNPSQYGPTPSPCELLDGVFLAMRGDTLRRAGVRFDERFRFHFYDMDFCRSARAAGLSLGTWPIMITHQSAGAFDSPGWREGYAIYLDKWKA